MVRESFVSLIDLLFSSGRVRKAIWRLWYPLLTRRLHGEQVLFLNYAYEEDPPMAIPLSPDDEPNRPCIQLYHHVAGQVPLGGKEVLEVSCGHGGGASYLARTFRPRNYTGLDLNPAGIRFCRQHHRAGGLTFVQGDAERLPFEACRFDAVINVEASHCYSAFPRFLAEAARVLRPGGHLLYADFRSSDRVAAWEQALAAAPLHIERTRSINGEVLRGMALNSARYQSLIAQRLPGWLHLLGRDFAGVTGSRTYLDMRSGERSYRSYCLVKPGPPATS